MATLTARAIRRTRTLSVFLTVAERMNACVDPRSMIMLSNKHIHLVHSSSLEIVNSIAMPTLNAVRLYCTSSPSAQFPYRYGDRVIFASSSSVSNSKVKCDWIPPQRVQSITDGLPLNLYLSGDGLHSLVLMDLLGVEIDTEQELFDYYIKTLARAVGSEEEAKRKIYLVSCGRRYGFGAEIDEKVEAKLDENLDVAYIFEDPFYCKRNKDPPVQPEVRFTPMNWNCRLDNIFSYHHLSERNTKWNSDHWLINIKQPDGGFSNKTQFTEFCIKLLAAVVGSDAAAVQKIYIIWLKFPFGFGAAIDEEASNILKCIPAVQTVLPDYAFDIKHNEHGHHQALHVYPSSCGLKYTHCHLTEMHKYEDWAIDMEEHVGHIDDFAYHPEKCYPDLTDFRGKSNRKHWFITMEVPGGECASVRKKVDCCLQTLASAVGSEVHKRIYRIKYVRNFIGFGIEVDEKIPNKLTGLRGIRGVLPDYSITKCYRARSHSHQNRLLNDIFSYYHLSEFNSDWNSDHWLIHVKQPIDGFHTEQQAVEYCIRMLADVLGSEEDAKRKIYVVWCGRPFGFGADIDENASNKLKGMANVLTVLPNFGLEFKNKKRGDLIISPSSDLKLDRRSTFYSSLVEEKIQDTKNDYVRHFEEIEKDNTDFDYSDYSDCLEDGVE